MAVWRQKKFNECRFCVPESTRPHAITGGQKGEFERSFIAASVVGEKEEGKRQSTHIASDGLLHRLWKDGKEKKKVGLFCACVKEGLYGYVPDSRRRNRVDGIREGKVSGNVAFGETRGKKGRDGIRFATKEVQITGPGELKGATCFGTKSKAHSCLLRGDAGLFDFRSPRENRMAARTSLLQPQTRQPFGGEESKNIPSPAQFRKNGGVINRR